MCTVRAFSKHDRFDFLADDQRLAVHFRGLLKAHHVEDRRRDVGEAAGAQLRARAAEDEGHHIRRVRGHRALAVGLEHLLGVAVVGGDHRDAAVKAVETVDECVGQVVEATLKMGGIAMITADHGNAEQMLQSDGKSPMTAHTTNVVPFILCGAGTELREGRLADIAPTILDVMGLEKPTEMDGKTLIVR